MVGEGVGMLNLWVVRWVLVGKLMVWVLILFCRRMNFLINVFGRGGQFGTYILIGMIRFMFLMMW